jgi:hypothetical protein
MEAMDANSHMIIASPQAPDSPRPTDGEPVRTSSNFIAAPCPAWHSAEDHALALLQWMQGPGGRIGEVPASELMKAHAEMCAEHFCRLGQKSEAPAFDRATIERVMRALKDANASNG